MTDEPGHGQREPGRQLLPVNPRPGPPHKAGGATLGLLLAVLLALVAMGGVVVARSDGPGTPSDRWPVGSPAGSADRSAATATGDVGNRRAAVAAARRDAVESLLADRARAVLQRDRDAFLATVDQGATALRARQRTWFDNLADLPLASWEHEPAAGSDGLAATGPAAFTATVHVRYRLAGHDRVPQRFRQQLSFGQRGGRWLVVGDPAAGGGADGVPVASHPPQLWDFGTVRAVTTGHGLVLGLVSREALRAYAREVDAAVPKVLDVWSGRWSGRVVVIVPRTEDQLAALLGGRVGQYARLAAITRGELGATDDAAPADRVYVNPQAFERLSRVGRQVIMAHEITHVATRAQTQRWTPKWLSEGLADYVGYRDSRLDTGVVAQELAADVRRGELPSALPGDEAFHGTRKDLPQIYEQSWLACRLIAEQYGEQTLTRFYRAVGDGPEAAAVERAFRELLGTTQERFTRDWRAYVQRLLR